MAVAAGRLVAIAGRGRAPRSALASVPGLLNVAIVGEETIYKAEGTTSSPPRAELE